MLSRLLRDIVTVIKEDGTKFEKIKASVQSNIVFIMDVSIPLEEGDIIQRQLQNGMTESFVVVDRGYHEGTGSIPASYQATVRRATEKEKNVYQAIGENAPTNISSSDKPLAFISHDSHDKDDVVRELVQELSKLSCPVWYDEYSLKVGDSLKKSIETGLKETQNCIVVLSPNFLSNEGWGKAEFDSVFTREILEKKNVILPVWHNVNEQEVYEYSPSLADKVGLNSNIGVKELARRLANEIKKTGT